MSPIIGKEIGRGLTITLTIFVDSSTDAGTVAMVTYEITLGNSSNFVSDDIELTSAAFIA